MNGRLDMTQLILDAGADVGAPPSPKEGITALQAAAKRGYLGIAMKLLEAGADVNEPPPPDGGRTALQEAAMNGRIYMVQLLLNAGIDQSGDGEMWFHVAIRLAREFGNFAVADLLENHVG
jgi:ankyrin repeat protein